MTNTRHCPRIAEHVAHVVQLRRLIAGPDIHRPRHFWPGYPSTQTRHLYTAAPCLGRLNQDPPLHSSHDDVFSMHGDP